MLKEKVILVDEQDNELGLMEKMEAHEKGLLHRAFSVFVFNSKNELMLQQRSDSKYHSGGLWTNTCCSHPRMGETLMEAAQRRMMEEMGFTCELSHEFSFIYKAQLDNNLIEHELDHVFFGFYDGLPQINPVEAKAWKYASVEEIKNDIQNHPQHYTEWFKIIFNRVEEHLQHTVKKIA
ncbi:MAG: isopentenyl-diphosphate Delta-isomerase [Bacteroidia bacterium]